MFTVRQAPVAPAPVRAGQRRLSRSPVPALVAMAATAFLVTTIPLAAQGDAPGRLPWKSVRWSIGCTDEYERALARIDSLHPTDPPTVSDCDPSDPTSAAAAGRYELELASAWLRDLGLAGPDISEMDGDRYVAKIDFYDAGKAVSLHTPCDTDEWGWYSYTVQILRLAPCYQFQALNEGDWTRVSAWGDLPTLTPVHELFHAVQFGYAGMNRDGVGSWIREGTAVLVQVQASKRGVSTLPYFLPRRFYDDPIHVPRTTDHADREWKRWAYGSWYFWDYLGERLQSPDRIAYLDTLFQQDLTENNGLSGIETGLLALGTRGLYDLYPAFVADRLDQPCYFRDLGTFYLKKAGTRCVRNYSRHSWADLGPGDARTITVHPAALATGAFVVRTHVPEHAVGRLRVEIPADHDDPAYHLVVGPRRVDEVTRVFGEYPFGSHNLYLGTASSGEDSVLVRVANVPRNVTGVTADAGPGPGSSIPVQVRLEVVKGVVSYAGALNGSYVVRSDPPLHLALTTGTKPYPTACSIHLMLYSEDGADLLVLAGYLAPPLKVGVFPIEDVANRHSGPLEIGIMSLQGRPACGHLGADCSAGAFVAQSRGGTFQVTRINRDIIEGRFRAPVGDATGSPHSVVEGQFVAALTGLLGVRLPAKHPCSPR